MELNFPSHQERFHLSCQVRSLNVLYQISTPIMVSAQPQELPGKCEAPTSYTLYRQGKFFMSFETVKQGVRIGDGAADDHSLKLFIKSERVQLIIFK